MTTDVVVAERLRALIAAVRAHRTGRVEVDEVLYVASAQTGDISGWESLVSATPRVARLDGVKPRSLPKLDAAE